jgi:hypothetical protein
MHNPEYIQIQIQIYYHGIKTLALMHTIEYTRVKTKMIILKTMNALSSMILHNASTFAAVWLLEPWLLSVPQFTNHFISWLRSYTVVIVHCSRSNFSNTTYNSGWIKKTDYLLTQCPIKTLFQLKVTESNVLQQTSMKVRCYFCNKAFFELCYSVQSNVEHIFMALLESAHIYWNTILISSLIWLSRHIQTGRRRQEACDCTTRHP